MAGWSTQILPNRVFEAVPPSRILTSVVVVDEVLKMARASHREPTAFESIGVLGISMSVPVYLGVALAAAHYGLEHGLHFSGPLVIATARRHDLELFTSDEALNGLLGVRFVRDGRPFLESATDQEPDPFGDPFGGSATVPVQPRDPGSGMTRSKVSFAKSFGSKGSSFESHSLPPVTGMPGSNR